MLRRDGLLVGLVAYFIGLRRDEVYELCAAVHHQLPGVVGHPDIGQSLFDHLVDGCSGDSQVVVVSRGRSHRGRESTTNQTKAPGASLRREQTRVESVLTGVYRVLPGSTGQQQQLKCQQKETPPQLAGEAKLS